MSSLSGPVNFIWVFSFLIPAFSSSSNDVAISLITSTRLRERLLENSRVVLTCIATITSDNDSSQSNENDDSSEESHWADIEVSIRLNNSDTVCYNDCTYMRSTAANGGPCEHFLKATRMHCVRGSCSTGPRNKSCEYELRRVSLAANGTSVTCKIGTNLSQKFALNLAVPTKLHSMEVQNVSQHEILSRSRNSITIYELPKSEMVLECTVRSLEPRTVRWTVTNPHSGFNETEQMVLEESADEPRGEYLWASRITVPATRNCSGRYRCLIFTNSNETVSGETHLQVYYGRDKSPFLESLVRENIVGEQQRFECQVGEALPQAEIVWQTNSGTGNQWINVSADDQLKNYSFQTRSYRGADGGYWVAAQLAFPLESKDFGARFRCLALHHGIASLTSKVLNISKIVFQRTILPANSNFGSSNHSNATTSPSNKEEIELKMSLNASCLLLEVSLPAQLLLFGREFCNESAVEQVTGHLVSDRLSLFRALENGSLTLDVKQAVIFARLAFNDSDYGPQKKLPHAQTFETHIVLEALKVPQDRALQILMQKLSGNQLQLLRRLGSLEKSVHEALTITKVNGLFCHYESEFLDYTSNDRVVKRNQKNREIQQPGYRYDGYGYQRYGNWSQIVNQWLSIRLTNPIYPYGKQEYSFRINRTGNEHTPMIGISMFNSASLSCGMINSMFHSKPKSWIYNSNEGTLYKGGNSVQYCKIPVSSNGVLRIRVDLSKRELAFFSTDINCGEIYLEITDDDLKNIYIVVEVFNLGDYVEIL